MQDDDGGVWHKQTSEKFCDFIMPEKDTLISYVIGTGKEPFKSTCATGDFAAVMAIAGARLPALQSGLRRQMPPGRRRRPGTGSEKYPNVTFPQSSRRLHRRLRRRQLRRRASVGRRRTVPHHRRPGLSNTTFWTITPHSASARDTEAEPPDWGNVAPLALWTYALGHGRNADAVAAITQDSVNAAQQIVERTGHHPYRISLTSADYIWGSNGVAANYGVQLLIANALRPDPRFVATALDNLHYLLGRNTFSLSWVTQVGASPFQHPHHRPSAGLPEPWPGLLSGGPNRGRQDGAMQKLPNGPPAKMYLDEQASYASNEVAINWNAPLVFVLAGALASH